MLGRRDRPAQEASGNGRGRAGCRKSGEEGRKSSVLRSWRLQRVRSISESRMYGRQIRRQQYGRVRQVGKGAALASPRGAAARVSISQDAVVGAVHPAAGRQQQLRLSQIERRRAGNQQQHPGDQQIGDQSLHIRSLVHFLAKGQPLH